ncbi:MAG: FG-GAP-like repeat-containing protein [Acidobacteriota bacterium]|nr:FG-GAP-like repeat-containing protein [Acidobacteriota bacterium]
MAAAHIMVKAAGEIDPTFNAGAYRQPAGTIESVVTQPDGKVLIGGNFEAVGGVFRGGVARLNTDGSIDTTFNPPSFLGGVNTVFIYAIGLQSNGKIIVAGQFSFVNGALSHPIVRLNTDGSLDTSFNLGLQNLSGYINDVDVRPDDKILIGGNFTYSAAGGTRVNLSRLNPNGTDDGAFNLYGNFSSPVFDLAVQPDGKILGFNTPNSGSERFLKRLNEDGTQDSTFNVLVNNTINAVKIQANGKIIIGGRFTNVNNFPRLGIARLNPNGTLDETFTSPLTTQQSITINDIEIGIDGKILIGGATFISSNFNVSPIFYKLNDNGSIDSSFNFNAAIPSNGNYTSIIDLVPLPNGQILIAGEAVRQSNRGAVVNRINSDGTFDNFFKSYIGNRGTIVDIAPLSNGQTVIGGVFGAVNNTVRPSIARLNADGSTDTTFNPTITGAGLDATVLAVTALPDNRVMVGGQFFGMLVRLNQDGSIDTSFATNTLRTSGPVYDIAVQPDGKVIGGGQLAPQSGTAARYVMRFNQDGTIDESFQAPVFSSGAIVRKVVLQPDGKVLIGGSFSNIAGLTRNGIARLNADGSLDTSFNPLGGANGAVLDVALQADGKVLLGGEFTIVNGESRSFAARLNADGSIDTTFNAISNSLVIAIKTQADGKILVGGSFTSIGGAARNRIARLNPNGTIDLTFNVGTGTDGNVHALALDTNGRILAGGSFVKYNNTPRVSIVRILNSNVPRPTPFDFNGDGRSDVSVFRPSTGFWYIARPTGSPSQNFDAVQFGVNGDVIVPADYDGDGKTDVAVWRPSDGVWYMMQSSAGFRTAQFGASGDIPVPGDFDGDGKANLAVFRPSTGSWYIARATGTPSQNFDTVPFGASGDKPIAGADFDGDGRADVAVFRPSDGNWYRINSSNNQFVGIHFGVAQDKPVAADYDGDGKTDFAVWRPSDGVWYRINSGSDTFTATQFGISTDLPAPADYDGDGKADLSVFRPSEGIWYLLRSTQGFTGVQFGASGDIPTPNAYVR